MKYLIFLLIMLGLISLNCTANIGCPEEDAKRCDGTDLETCLGGHWKITETCGTSGKQCVERNSNARCENIETDLLQDSRSEPVDDPTTDSTNNNVEELTEDFAEAELEPVSEALYGEYNVQISGYWTGTCQLSISERDIYFSELDIQAEGWQANLPNPVYAESSELIDNAWIITWDLVVSVNEEQVRQQWITNWPVSQIEDDRMEGTYTHISDLTGEHSGELIAID